MRHAADRLSVLWYLGYDLGEPLPDHSSLTRIRERYGVDVFRRFFEAIVEQCQQAGLVWGKGLYIDATKVEANASLDSLTPRFAVEAHLANIFVKEVAAQTEQHLTQEEETVSEPDKQAEGEGVMSTSVRRAKNSTTLRPIPPRTLVAIRHVPKTVITVRSKPNVLLASKDRACAAAWMKTRWIGCVLMHPLSPTRRPYASTVSGSSRYLPKGNSGMACVVSVYANSGEATARA